MRIAAVILAAGASTRFGSRKQAVRIAGRTMLATVAQTAHDADLAPVIAVVPPGWAVDADVVPVINDRPHDGLSRSLQLGLSAVPVEAEAAVILLGDQPTMAAATIRALTEHARADRPIVVASADGRIGPPVLLLRDGFRLADAAGGDEGLRSILAAHPDMITEVEVGEHVPDIDTRQDLDAVAPACPGCGARVPADPDAPTHPYIGASAGCWTRWSELQATTGIGGIGRVATDAYAAQHPGSDGRRQRQSVAVHLIALCHWLEHGIDDPRLTELTRAALDARAEWPWLTPPGSYDLTVHDLPQPASADDGRRWAMAVWRAWAPHHATIRGWSSGLLAGRRRG